MCAYHGTCVCMCGMLQTLGGAWSCFQLKAEAPTTKVLAEENNEENIIFLRPLWSAVPYVSLSKLRSLAAVRSSASLTGDKERCCPTSPDIPLPISSKTTKSKKIWDKKILFCLTWMIKESLQVCTNPSTGRLRHVESCYIYILKKHQLRNPPLLLPTETPFAASSSCRCPRARWMLWSVVSLKRAVMGNSVWLWNETVPHAHTEHFWPRSVWNSQFHVKNLSRRIKGAQTLEMMKGADRSVQSAAVQRSRENRTVIVQDFVAATQLSSPWNAGICVCLLFLKKKTFATCTPKGSLTLLQSNL